MEKTISSTTETETMTTTIEATMEDENKDSNDDPIDLEANNDTNQNSSDVKQQQQKDDTNNSQSVADDDDDARTKEEDNLKVNESHVEQKNEIINNNDNNNDNTETSSRLPDRMEGITEADTKKGEAAGGGDANGSANTPPHTKLLYEYNEIFYDPITHELMTDPVVHPNGDSYERSVAMEQFDYDASEYYPNRALKAIIEAEIQKKAKEQSSSSSSLSRSMRKLNTRMRSSWKRLLDASALPIGERYQPLPISYYCPITYELITSPVIDPDGNTYDKRAIYHWIHANATSPVTRKPLRVGELYNNNALNDLIDLEQSKTNESIHPSIRRWIDEKKKQDDHDEEENSQNFGGFNFPTTEEEIQSRREPVSHCTIFGVTIVLFLLAFALVYYPWILLVTFIGFILYSRDQSNESNMPVPD